LTSEEDIANAKNLYNYYRSLEDGTGPARIVENYNDQLAVIAEGEDVLRHFISDELPYSSPSAMAVAGTIEFDKSLRFAHLSPHEKIIYWDLVRGGYARPVTPSFQMLYPWEARIKYMFAKGNMSEDLKLAIFYANSLMWPLADWYYMTHQGETPHKSLFMHGNYVPIPMMERLELAHRDHVTWKEVKQVISPYVVLDGFLLALPKVSITQEFVGAMFEDSYVAKWVDTATSASLIRHAHKVDESVPDEWVLSMFDIKVRERGF